MGKDKKIFKVDSSVIESAIEDIAKNQITFYTRKSFPNVLIEKDIIHEAVSSKSSTFSVACSACEADKRRYVYVCAHREDHGKIDLDPICFAFNIETNMPAPLGLILFHGSFEGRTTPRIDIDEMVKELLCGAERVTVGFNDVRDCFSNAMHYVAEKFRIEFEDE